MTTLTDKEILREIDFDINSVLDPLPACTCRINYPAFRTEQEEIDYLVRLLQPLSQKRGEY